MGECPSCKTCAFNIFAQAIGPVTPIIFEVNNKSHNSDSYKSNASLGYCQLTLQLKPYGEPNNSVQMNQNENE